MSYLLCVACREPPMNAFWLANVAAIVLLMLDERKKGIGSLRLV